MSDRVFIDTNVFVYAYLESYKNEEDYVKHLKAKELLQSFKKGTFVCISTQVCNEYYSVLLKNKIEHHHIQSSLKSLIRSTTVTPISENTVLQSFDIRNRYGFSYWDSLILSSALESECTVLYSEDMQDEQVINGVLQVINPFS
jgi:predicted nucleic acid-binding protein